MAGSSIRINTPSVSNDLHNNLLNRDVPFQHPLESVFRQSDQKDLKTIIEELTAIEKSILCELIEVATTGDRIINLTLFSYNMAMDVLLVFHGSNLVYEGTTNDYVKTTGTSITFNYDLTQGDKVYVILAGTISGESFGDSVYNGISQFKQLADAPSSYYNHGGQVVKVNDTETGLIFGVTAISQNLTMLEYTYTIDATSYQEGWLAFVHSGIIKGIKITTDVGYTGPFRLKIWDSSAGEWIYYSGDIQNILWDIMDIPHIDTSGQDSVYIRLENDGTASNFVLKIYILL